MGTFRILQNDRGGQLLLLFLTIVAIRFLFALYG